MESSPHVEIVVVNWNGSQYTVRCLDSLRKLEYAGFHALVVDNGSGDGSAARIRAAHPEIELIELVQNLGFAGGSNAGIREALRRGASYVWALNNDIIVEPDSLTLLLDVARSRERVGVVGPAVWRPPTNGGSVQETAAFRWRGEYRLVEPCSAEPTNEPFHLVDDVAGSSIFLEARMLGETGLFDERFFHYWEDAELCVRARKAGWLVAHSCRARVWHTVGGTLSTGSPQAQYYFVRNWLLFARWTGRGGFLTMLRRAPRMTLGLVLARRWLLRGRVGMTAAAILGVIDAQRGRYGQRDLPRWLG